MGIGLYIAQNWKKVIEDGNVEPMLMNTSLLIIPVSIRFEPGQNS